MADGIARSAVAEAVTWCPFGGHQVFQIRCFKLGVSNLWCTYHKSVSSYVVLRRNSDAWIESVEDSFADMEGTSNRAINNRMSMLSGNSAETPRVRHHLMIIFHNKNSKMLG